MQKWSPAEPVCVTRRLNSIACIENAVELVPLNDQNWMLSPHALTALWLWRISNLEERTYKEW